MATTAATRSMKLLIDRKAKRVLFAEASKEVVDFLFSLLALPVATAVKLVGKDAMVGCVGNLYTSVEKLDATYVQTGAAKDSLLKPTVISPSATSHSSLLGLPPPTPEQPKTFYRCSYIENNMTDDGYGNYRNRNCFSGTSRCSSNYVTDASGTSCPNCGNEISVILKYVAPPSSGASGHGQSIVTRGGKGFVQGIVTYTVMDNLTVSPMSAISSITLLNTFAVRDIGDLQEKTVQLGYTEGLAVLKASLQSKTVLTDVFLGNNKAPAGRA